MSLTQTQKPTAPTATHTAAGATTATAAADTTILALIEPLEEAFLTLEALAANSHKALADVAVGGRGEAESTSARH